MTVCIWGFPVFSRAVPTLPSAAQRVPPSVAPCTFPWTWKSCLAIGLSGRARYLSRAAGLSVAQVCSLWVVLSTMGCVSCLCSAAHSCLVQWGWSKLGALNSSSRCCSSCWVTQDTNAITLICAHQKLQLGLSLGSGCKPAPLLGVSLLMCLFSIIFCHWKICYFLTQL